jgi:tetratricopeptide (TPR) repeat protein
MSQGRADKAEADLVAAAAVDPNDASGHVVLGDFYLRQGRLAEAERAYLAAARAKPADPLALARLGELYLRTGRKEEASAFVDRILEANPQEPDGLLLRAMVLLEERKASAAVPILQDLVKRDPARHQPHYALGLAREAQRDHVQARAAFARAVELAPGNVEARVALARVHLRTRAPDPALEQTEAVLRILPKHRAALLLASEAYVLKKDLRKSKDALQRLIEVDRKDAAAHVRLGTVEAGLGDTVAGIASLERALELDPDVAGGLPRLAGLHVREKRTDLAIRRVEQQLRVSPGNYLYQTLVGELYQLAGDAAKAEKAYRAAVDLRPKAIAAYLLLAKLRTRQNDHDAAVAEFEKVKAIQPKFVPAYVLLGLIYEQRNQTDRARAEYEAALGIDPKFAPAANNLAWIYAEHVGDLDRALALAETAHYEEPDDARITDTLGWIHYRRKAYLKAVTLLEESSRALPDNPVVHYHLGMAHVANGDRDLGRRALSDALALSQSFPGADEARRTLNGL